LSGLSATDPDAVSDKEAFESSLQNFGWTVGRNLIIDYRWSAVDAAHARAFAKELLSLSPDVVLTTGTGSIAALRVETRTVPIVFTRVSDPVGQGIVDNLAKPGGNVTGFSNFEPAIAGKWLQILKEIAPNIVRVAVIANPETSDLESYFRAVVRVSNALAIEPVSAPIRDLDDIERAMAAAAETAGGGLIIVPDAIVLGNRALVFALARKYRLPAIYPFRFFANEGGLVSYGIDTKEQFREAALYVDRILHGENPGDLPVQAPVKFELVINLRTAKALGINVPPSLLAVADELIE
jgi:putative ABC transport system substrate-binding protein